MSSTLLRRGLGSHRRLQRSAIATATATAACIASPSSKRSVSTFVSLGGTASGATGSTSLSQPSQPSSRASSTSQSSTSHKKHPSAPFIRSTPRSHPPSASSPHQHHRTSSTRSSVDSLTPGPAFHHRTTLVTGGSGGIGLAIAAAFRNLGSRVLLVARDPSRLEAAVAELRALDPLEKVQAMEWCMEEAGDVESGARGVAGLVADVSRVGEVEGVVKVADAPMQKVMQRYGPVDYLVNAAGVSRTGLLATADSQQMEEVVATNLLGTIHMSRGIARGMLRRSRNGCIINISSVLGIKGVEGASAYSASKAGVLGFTRSLARELGPKGIRVSAIAPGFIETAMTADMNAGRREAYLSMTPLKRFGKPEDVARAAVFLAQSEFMTGQTIVVD
ncbi:hypothetical protein HDU96_003425, partial [Phlyctochytrium bullatum]